MKEGKKLSRNFEKKINRNNRMKVHILDTVIFPSMANLLYFFWQVSLDYKFRDLFDDDIKELFGVKRNDPFSNTYGYVFASLIDNMLVWGLTGNSGRDYYSEYERIKDTMKGNFRIRLLHILQSIIQKHMQFLSNHYLTYTMYSSELMRPDLIRALVWTAQFATNSNEEYDLSLDLVK